MQPYSRFIGILAVMAALSAHGEIPSDPTQVHPLPVGARVPMFEGVTADGKVRSFTPSGFLQPTIVIFYRGGWCPYCNMQLSDLRLVEPKLREQGFEIVFLSTDRPEILYSSLKAADIHYTLLSDSHLEAAKAFHVAYHLDDATLAKQKQYGVNLDETTGTPLHELPVPSVFIIDATGTIRYVYSNPDYTVRLASDALLAAAQPYAARGTAAK
ncbi:MAG TPA: peroxiredoxin family protein [Steroidobacteraceae bacterium]|jgi:peroxiredoxin